MKSLIEEMVTWLAGQKMSPMELKKHLQEQKIRKNIQQILVSERSQLISLLERQEKNFLLPLLKKMGIRLFPITA